MQVNEVTEKVIGCALLVHKKLGAGFLESVYQSALEYEMKKVGLKFEKEKILPVKYEEIYLELGFRCDFYVEDCVIIECKAVKELINLDEAQLLNYLKVANIKVGLLINFNTEKLIDGLKRLVNYYDEE
ncbi:GxxExxY protein [Candidatus Dependentiae bacterium]|nr:GxxExxY protein [Candidatus Dependentiae bacterium]